MNVVLGRVLLQGAKQAGFIPETLLHQLFDHLWFCASVCLCFTRILLTRSTDFKPSVWFRACWDESKMVLRSRSTQTLLSSPEPPVEIMCPHQVENVRGASQGCEP